MHLTLYITRLAIGCRCTIADVDLLTCQWSPLHLSTLVRLWITGGWVHLEVCHCCCLGGLCGAIGALASRRVVQLKHFVPTYDSSTDPYCRQACAVRI